MQIFTWELWEKWEKWEIIVALAAKNSQNSQNSQSKFLEVSPKEPKMIQKDWSVNNWQPYGEADRAFMAKNGSTILMKEIVPSISTKNRMEMNIDILYTK